MASGYPGRDGRGRLLPGLAPCRDCQAPTIWAATSNGKRLQLDPTPAGPPPLGRLFLVVKRSGDWRLAVELHDPELRLEVLELEGLDLHYCHFDTCPKRRPRERADLA